jgi:membrane protease YdiL (CAAX protease family)
MKAILQPALVGVRSIATGLIVSLAGIYTWSGLALLNQRYLLEVPWAAAVMAVILYFYWNFLNGKYLKSGSNFRHACLRARTLSPEVWGAAIFAGMMGLIALMPLMAVIARLVELPPASGNIDVPASMPALTVFISLLMASLVAGAVEEAAFRGYMQGPLERRFGPGLGILLTGLVFAYGHYGHHPDHMLGMLPYYLAVSALWGTLAYLTKSILPGLALHAFGDVWVLTRQWLTGAPGWQAAPEPVPLVWQTGIDAAFIGSLIGFLVFGGMCIGAFYALAKTVKEEPAYVPEYKA